MEMWAAKVAGERVRRLAVAAWMAWSMLKLVVGCRETT